MPFETVKGHTHERRANNGRIPLGHYGDTISLWWRRHWFWRNCSPDRYSNTAKCTHNRCSDGWRLVGIGCLYRANVDRIISHHQLYRDLFGNGGRAYWQWHRVPD